MEIPTIEWSSFLNRLDWRQGEHVALIGPTGSGKTTLGLAILKKRGYVVIFGTKPTGGDETLSGFIKDEGYAKLKEFPDYFDETKYTKIVVWPKYTKPKDKATQRLVIGNGLLNAFMQRNWAIFVDEVYYLTNQLRLGKMVEDIWTQGRSIGISLIAGTQRPAYVPLMIYDQSTHLFFWRDNDEANLKRIGGIGWLNSRLIRDTVARLPKHDVLYVNTRTGAMAITRVNLQ